MQSGKERCFGTGKEFYEKSKKEQKKKKLGNENEIYIDGDIVWAQHEDWPWWPAKVITE